MSGNTIHSTIGTDEQTQSQAAGAATLGEHSIEKATGKQPPLNQPTQKLSKQQLLERYCGLEKLPEGQVQDAEQIGQGSFGTVFRGTLTVKTDNNKQIDIIVKKSNTGNDNELNEETNISSTIMDAAKEHLQKDDNLASSQEGFSNVAFQQKIGDNHVQKCINGNDGFEAIYKQKLDLYNTETGHPADITQVLGLVQQFLNAIHALHEQGIAHCDIKPENIMIEMTDNGPKLTIIDLGGATQHGSSTQTTSLNCAPEALECLNKQGNFTSTPQADIYAAGTVLCELLFGACKYEYDDALYALWDNFFWANQNESYTFDPSFYSSCDDPKSDLRQNLDYANQLNGQTLYPPAIFNAISDLIVKMCAIDPNERPSSQYCLAVLNDLVLCDHDAIRNGTTGTNKPMITGSLPQAMQLIYDLNNLNQKESLTPEEQATKEVLIYNLKRDFEIPPEDTELADALKNAIQCASNGTTISQEALQPLIKKQKETLQEIQYKLNNINSDKTQELKEKISKQLGKAQAGNLISQNDINNLRTAVTIEIQKNTLQNLKTQLDGINTDQANKLKEEIDAALQKLQGNEEQGIKPVMLTNFEINKIVQEAQEAQLKNINSQLKTLQELKTKLKGRHRILHNIKVFFKSLPHIFSKNIDHTKAPMAIDVALNDAIERLEISQKNLKWLIEDTKKGNDTSYLEIETIQALTEKEIANLSKIVTEYDKKRQEKKNKKAQQTN